VSLVLLLLAVVVVGVVAAVAVGLVAGGLTAPVPTSPHRPLPSSPVSPDDVDGLRFSLALRGYRMDEVDAALHRLREELADRDARLAAAGRAPSVLDSGREG
jgi:DivIVA domain-containing protein